MYVIVYEHGKMYTKQNISMPKEHQFFLTWTAWGMIVFDTRQWFKEVGLAITANNSGSIN